MTNMTVAFVCDYAEEGWPSMDTVGTLLPQAVARRDDGITVERRQPCGRRWFGLAGSAGRAPSIRERLVNRYVFYPRWLRRQDQAHRVFHIVDHTYAHLVDELPAEHTIVTCHDLDAFGCVLAPERSPRPWLFRQAVLRTMRGLQRAACTACVSETVREGLIAAGLVEPSRTVVVPNGIHPAFTSAADPGDAAEVERLLGRRRGDADVDLLHVGIPIPRKRIDVALQVLAHLRLTHPTARLIRVGGALTPALRAMAARLGVAQHILELPFLSPGALASVYRRASVLLVPSDREGFALPLAEALACGTPVVANDVAVLRETGGCLARYRDNSDVEGWCREIVTLLERPCAQVTPWRVSARAHAGRFSWEAAADRLVPIYRELYSR